MQGCDVRRIGWIATPDAQTNAVISYAAGELADYAYRLYGTRWTVDSMAASTPIASTPIASAPIASAPLADWPTVWLGLADQFPGSPLTLAEWDDGYAIWARDVPIARDLFIVGRNARSVLFGIYTFLEMQGVRFVFPGEEGDVVPPTSELTVPAVPLVQQAQHRHRGVCIEGATSLEHALAVIDWCAKKRMNTVFLQFVSSRYFFNNWYERRYNPQFAGPPLNDAQALALDDLLIAAMKQRGLVFHRVGHGWTSAAVGLPRSGWVTADEEVPPQYVRWLAEVDGTRELFHNIPINTELCYSHPPALQGLVETIVGYSEQHPEMDVVHVWLSDATNNKCECADCRKLSISDWYVQVINALSKALHERIPEMRFVFLCYIELLWPPEQLTIDEQYGNIIMMFAPIARCYGHALHDPACDDGQEWPRPPVNQFHTSRHNAFYETVLAGWRKAFGGDSFDFDYHLMWANWFQLTDTRIAWLLHEDLSELKQRGLDGIISCQGFRVFYPSGLAMTTLAEALWNPQMPFEQIRAAYLQAAYGEHAALAGEYLDTVEKLVNTGDPHWRTPPFSTATAAQLDKAAAFLADSLAQLNERLNASDKTRQRALRLLAHHARLLQFIVAAHQSHLAGHPEQADQQLDQAVAWLQNTEAQHSQDIDVMLAIRLAVNPHRAG